MSTATRQFSRSFVAGSLTDRDEARARFVDDEVGVARVGVRMRDRDRSAARRAATR